MHLIDLEEENILRVMSDGATEIPSNHTMPGPSKLFIHLLLDIRRHVLLNLELVHRFIDSCHRLVGYFWRNICPVNANLGGCEMEDQRGKVREGWGVRPVSPLPLEPLPFDSKKCKTA